jgi:hypothetical protein
VHDAVTGQVDHPLAELRGGGIRMALVTWWALDELVRTKMLPHEVS